MACNCSKMSDPRLPICVSHSVECPEFWIEIKSIVEGLVHAIEEHERLVGYVPSELAVAYVTGKMALREPICQKE